jgi:galactosylxylosylprotein 3-beta-galactosyltransferase
VLLCLAQEGLRCLHLLHTQEYCATPALNDGQLPLFSYYNYTVDHKWISERAPQERWWRFDVHGHNHEQGHNKG